MLKRHISKVLLLLVYIYLYTPIFILIGNSFNASKYGLKWKGFTTTWYELLWSNDTLLQAAFNSITIAVFASSIAVVIGTLGAVALFKHQFKGKKFISGLLFVVMMSPDIVMAISLLALFIILGLDLGFATLLIAHITFCIPFVVITVYSRLSNFDNAILEAGKDLGASEATIFKRIILPIAKPAIIASWLLSFTLSLDDVIVSSFVTGPSFEVLPLKIYSMVKVGVSPEVNALATVMILISISFVIAAALINKGEK
ncbi:spermidine/putrescine ABC transporter permease PotC [Moritella viscosa]|uniref:Spermidine/putrescine transport system permease protein PotC n=1 Tax=Moritella viscosa TaxID=80854 RepID=A0A090IDU9_9GAMM|nr:spermidine/putrescine ABC transporter permease PotC [Moritella viscosa]CED60206.1 spermidine/putrescine ABC transporter, permease [Moritella viscosa]SGY98717.1 Putative spermidine/putrescine ABC transporter, permease protein [Moritella viscosa]SGZ05646.1 Putative spermidine/putrescine ABC transporter, permease protein [Moritella viscosa]SGZ05829.1 Putative spermidine/putrescine ABC transporter, permease protein [Moritella viscosa]SGZ12860.1 Putative spermidine/putrescine ABC transporter, pe